MPGVRTLPITPGMTAGVHQVGTPMLPLAVLALSLAAPPATNNDIREKAMGNENRKPTSEEQAKMEGLVEQAMKDGAWGLSTGLIYNPGTYSETEEIIGLARAAAKYKGMYASHIRDESTGLLV